MIKKLLYTESNLELFILRVVLGLVMFAHGAQKLFGIWGGHGVEWTIEAWGQWWNMPAVLTYMVIIIESIGSLLLILGFLTRVWAFFMAIIMVVAVYLVHLRWGFYMNWYMEPQKGEGFEYHLIVMAILAALMLKGGGKWSLDSSLIKKRNAVHKSFDGDRLAIK
jgi:putative oxidoreductase